MFVGKIRRFLSVSHPLLSGVLANCTAGVVKHFSPSDRNAVRCAKEMIQYSFFMCTLHPKYASAHIPIDVIVGWLVVRW